MPFFTVWFLTLLPPVNETNLYWRCNERTNEQADARWQHHASQINTALCNNCNYMIFHHRKNRTIWHSLDDMWMFEREEAAISCCCEMMPSQHIAASSGNNNPFTLQKSTPGFLRLSCIEFLFRWPFSYIIPKVVGSLSAKKKKRSVHTINWSKPIVDKNGMRLVMKHEAIRNRTDST